MTGNLTLMLSPCVDDNQPVNLTDSEEGCITTSTPVKENPPLDQIHAQEDASVDDVDIFDNADNSTNSDAASDSSSDCEDWIQEDLEKKYISYMNEHDERVDILITCPEDEEQAQADIQRVHLIRLSRHAEGDHEDDAPIPGFVRLCRSVPDTLGHRLKSKRETARNMPSKEEIPLKRFPLARLVNEARYSDRYVCRL